MSVQPEGNAGLLLGKYDKNQEIGFVWDAYQYLRRYKVWSSEERFGNLESH